MWCGMFFIGTALTDPLLVTREQASHVSDRPAKTALLAFFGGQWPACKLQRCDDKRNFFFFAGDDQRNFPVILKRLHTHDL